MDPPSKICAVNYVKFSQKQEIREGVFTDLLEIANSSLLYFPEVAKFNSLNAVVGLGLSSQSINAASERGALELLTFLN